MNVVSIVGWSFLVMSWILPMAIKDKIKREYARMGLSGIALGVFLTRLMCDL